MLHHPLGHASEQKQAEIAVALGAEHYEINPTISRYAKDLFDRMAPARLRFSLDDRVEQRGFLGRKLVALRESALTRPGPERKVRWIGPGTG
jgi:hypothetical protein